MLRKYVSLLVVLIMVLTLSGCGKEEVVQPKDIEQNLFFDENDQMFLPVKNLVIMATNDDIFFSTYVNISDKFFYEIFTENVIYFSVQRSNPFKKNNVGNALNAQYIFVDEHATDLYEISMIPELSKKIIEKEGELYISLSDLENARDSEFFPWNQK